MLENVFDAQLQQLIKKKKALEKRLTAGKPKPELIKQINELDEEIEFSKKVNEKSLLIHNYHMNKHAFSPEQVFDMMQRAADLEAEIVEVHLKRGNIEEAVTNMISQASCLVDTGAKKEAKAVFQRAHDLTKNNRMKQWIKDHIKEQKLRWA